MGFLDIDNTTKSYGAVEVLHKVDISVEEGEFLVLVAPSGCAKSTLLNMIAGLEDITRREIRIKDKMMNGVHAREGEKEGNIGRDRRGSSEKRRRSRRSKQCFFTP